MEQDAPPAFWVHPVGGHVPCGDTLEAAKSIIGSWERLRVAETARSERRLEKNES